VTLAQHSAVTVQHGTPPMILEMGRRVLGGEYDLDPASSGYWNGHHVRAARFIDEAEDGLKADWRVVPGMRIICNPPGDGLVAPFFQRCVEAWRAGAGVWWVGFSLEQLAYLQDDGALDRWHTRVIPRRRIDFLAVATSAQPSLFGDIAPDAPRLQGSPTHANYVLLMSSGQDAHGRLEAEAAAMHCETF